MQDRRESGYNGNENLKRAGAPINLTEEQMVEWFRCADDPVYFSEKYIKVNTIDHGFVNIELYDFQKDIIISVMNNRRTIVNTSRQIGKTTTAVCIILHYILFNKDKQVGLLANKGDAAREILERIQNAYEALPKWLQAGVKEWNKGTVILENKCKVIATATSGSAARGKSFSFVYIDETAFVENWGPFYRSVYPTLTSGNTSKMLFTSTPNGMNHFYKFVIGAKEGRNGFNLIEVPWYAVPGRDETWKEETINSLDGDMDAFAQEFCLEFQGSSGTLIAGWKLKELVHHTPEVENKDGLSLYNRPNHNRQYMMICDVSRGKGLDYSAFHVIDTTEMPYEQVCTFRSNLITPIEYAEIIFRVGKLFNDCPVLVEINDIGEQVSNHLYEVFEYENVLMTESAGRAGKRISGGFGGNVDMGIRTTKTVKAQGCSILKLLIEQNQLIIKDFETISELSTFSKKGVSYEAESGHNDDLVMGLVLFAWLSGQSYFKELNNIDTISKLRDKTEEELMNTLLPFGIVDDGVDIQGDSYSENSQFWDSFTGKNEENEKDWYEDDLWSSKG